MRESRAITISTIPVISAFCSPERGVRGEEAIFGWGLGEDRVVRLGVLPVDIALLAGAFFVVTLFERGVVARGFVVVLAFVAVGFLLVVRVAIIFSAGIADLIIHFGKASQANLMIQRK